MLDIAETVELLVAVTLLSTYLLAFACRNTKYKLKNKIAVKRQEAIANELNQQLLSKRKKMSNKEKEIRTHWKRDQVADHEATTFSIFYNNALFIALVIFESFILLRSFPSPFNYAVSVCCASVFLALLSKRSQ